MDLIDAVQGDEDHAPVDDDGLDRSTLKLLTRGAAVEVTVFRPCILGSFEVEEGGRVVAELAFVLAFVGIGDVRLKGEEGVAVEAVEVLIGSFELIGVAGVEVDLRRVGFAGVGIGRGEGLRGVGDEDGAGWRWRWPGDRIGPGELSEGERGAEQENCRQDGVAGGHGVGPFQL